MRTYAGRPDDRARQDAIAIREDGGVRLDAFELRVDADVDAASLELVRRVVAELPRDLGKDSRRRVDKHPVLRFTSKGPVVAQCVPYEVGQLAERFDPRVARADEDERQLATTAPLRRGGARSLQPTKDVVA